MIAARTLHYNNIIAASVHNAYMRYDVTISAPIRIFTVLIFAVTADLSAKNAKFAPCKNFPLYGICCSNLTKYTVAHAPYSYGSEFK